MILPKGRTVNKDEPETDENPKHSFFNLSPEVVLDSVEELGFRCTGRCLSLNSMENRVYEVEIEGTPGFEPTSRYDLFRVVKFYRPGRWTREQIMEEHRFLLEAAAVDIPVVTPLRFSDDTTIREVAAGGIFFSIFPKVGGRIRDEFTDAELQQLGRLVARLHNVGATRPHVARPLLSPENYGRNNVKFLEESVLIPKNMLERYTMLVRSICDISDPWFAETPVQRIHGDFHIGNILWDGPMCKIVDFDDTMAGPCIQDLWLVAPGVDEEALKRRDALLEGYASMRTFNRESVRLIEPLRALRIVHFNAWIAKRWDDPAFKRVFVDYGSDAYWVDQIGALSEVLERMHGRGTSW